MLPPLPSQAINDDETVRITILLNVMNYCFMHDDVAPILNLTNIETLIIYTNNYLHAM